MSKHFTVLVYNKTWTSCGWGGLLFKYQIDTVEVIWFARSDCTGSTPESVHVCVCVPPTFFTFNLQPSSFSQRSESCQQTLEQVDLWGY